MATNAHLIDVVRPHTDTSSRVVKIYSALGRCDRRPRSHVVHDHKHAFRARKPRQSRSFGPKRLGVKALRARAFASNGAFRPLPKKFTAIVSLAESVSESSRSISGKFGFAAPDELTPIRLLRSRKVYVVSRNETSLRKAKKGTMQISHSQNGGENEQYNRGKASENTVIKVEDQPVEGARAS